ncbi:type I secretion system permease/ATPase [Neorhizobium sp. JUb45]|uniref:type I secretion system permease/ATPase n=1 Tax=unclassified Neorhizobium TaxID=2629175 RepID=UPI00104A9F22|nr:type I secretion system permease/ATPase [Neorhizobium sp. JUb45]TCQ98247.1 ATP-binding cassette subfamily C protein/ATP-binding cassette subfamily C exporter for protease/lipase/ATP-binding cassette subfamily C protein EexD [Neorhizobium sp. JUb45]
MTVTAYSKCMQGLKAQTLSLMVFSTASNLLALISSIYMMQVFDRILSTGSHDTLLWLTVAAIAGLLAMGLIDHARRRMLALAGAWMEERLATTVIGRCVHAKLAGFKSEASTADLADLRAFIGGEAMLAFLDAPWMPFFIAILWLMHPMLGALTLAGAALLLGLAILNEILTRQKSVRAAGEQRFLQQQALEIVEQAEIVRPLGMISNMLQRWRRMQQQVHASSHGAQEITERISAVTKTLRMALQILIMCVGAYLVLAGELTSGGMIAASILLGRALSPVERALGAWRHWVSACKARRNLTALFEAVPEERKRTQLPVPKGRLTVEAVRHVTHGAIEPVLRRVDFVVEVGTTCGLIGTSGSGKSTLCRLIVGAWTATSGHVRLDGADVASWDPDELGQHIGYLPQEPKLFAGTIADNIARMGQGDPQAVMRAAQMADVHEMILRLPDGYETDVGLHGHRLSGGQRQRIALARALYGNPALIVLDEPNSNLDGQGEEALRKALLELKRLGKTILIVAHQPSALRTADTLIVLRDGIVQAQGPRSEVLRDLAVGLPASSYDAGSATHPFATLSDAKAD